MADQKKLSAVLSQAQLDAEATFAAAAGVNPAQAALIKQNAQGNIMSPGVLESLSALGVSAKSGVASSIANIDAATREQRLANQKDVASKRQEKEFKDTNRGQVWQAIKGVSRGIVTAFSAIPQFVDSTYRTTRQEIGNRGVVSGLTAGLGINPFISGEEQGKIAEQTLAQTQYGQIVTKSIADAKKGKFPDINMGEGFFASEEVGIGHAARQASLGAAKIAIL